MQYIQTKTVYIDRDELIEIKAIEHDVKTRFIDFKFIAANKVLDISHCIVRVYALNSKGNEIFNNLTITDGEKGIAQLELTDALLLPGVTEYMLKITTDNGGILSSNRFNLIVNPDLMTGNAIEGTNEYKALDEALKTVGELNSMKVSIVENANAINKNSSNLNKHENKLGILSNTVISNLRNTEGIISKIASVVKSYTDNFEKITYGNIYTAYDKEVKLVDGKYQLDCSSFINLLIHGVSFYNSRYNGKNENYGSPLFFQGIDSYKYRLANQMAKFFMENGYTFKPSKDFSNIRAGDLVFYSWNDFDTNPDKYTQNQIDFHNNAFMKIDHVAMYLDRKNDSFYQTIQFEKNTPFFLFDVDLEYMEQSVLVARLPFANVENYNSKNMIVNGEEKQVCKNSIRVGTYYLNKKLKKGTMYSLSINGTIDTGNCYFLIRANGKTIYSDYGRNITNGTYSFYFIYKEDIEVDKITVEIGCINSELQSRNGHVNWCSLNEGYRIISDKPQNTGEYNSRELPLTSFIKDKIVDGFASTYKLLETNTHFLINLNLSFSEDFKSNEIVIGNLNRRISNTMRLPCNLISYNNKPSSGILQFKWDGEISIIKFDNEATWRHAMASGIIVK